MPVLEQQLAAIVEIRVIHVNKGLSKVGQRRQQFLLHALPIPVGDLVNATLRVERVSEELVLVGLHNALKFLGEITGETTTEDILTQIFSTFCIGK